MAATAACVVLSLWQQTTHDDGYIQQLQLSFLPVWANAVSSEDTQTGVGALYRWHFQKDG